LFTQPPLDFPAWVLDHVAWRGDERALDIGSGSGAYVEPLCGRLTHGGRVLAGDLSWGMLRDLAAKSLLVSVVLLNADARRLPLPDGCCDVVLANHMLFHVPQMEAAVIEFCRVLRPGGHLLAATNARDAMQSFITQMEEAVCALGYPGVSFPVSPHVRFTLENGWDVLRPCFPDVVQHVDGSALVFPDATPAVAYIDSLRPTYEPWLPDGIAWETLIEQVERQIRAQIAARGVYRVAKTGGVFIATRQM
jgi:SAM-dependent methyltransferase